MTFTQHHSIYGRMLGVSSTGGLISAVGSTGNKGSTAFDMAAQMWGPSLFTTASSSGATFADVGYNVVSSATSTAMTFTMPAPSIKGQHAHILIESSASAVTIDTSATTILFNDTGNTAAGSTSIAVTAADLYGYHISLVALNSSDRWQVLQSA